MSHYLGRLMGVRSKIIGKSVQAGGYYGSVPCTSPEATNSSFYAHTHPDFPSDCEKWEPLFTADCPALEGKDCMACTDLHASHGHLNKVAWWTSKFAEALDAKEWGFLAGKWHDLGKYSEDFRNYLFRASAKANPHGEDLAGLLGRVDHSTAGAKHAAARKPLGPLMGYLIAGHHAGLPDGVELRERLIKKIPEWEINCPSVLKSGSIPNPGISQSADAPPAPGPFRLALFLRMVFSALVDADFLCTEAFMSQDAATLRPDWPDDVMEMMERALIKRLDDFGAPKTRVGSKRLYVRNACESAAGLEPGFFDLTVPTGGGKTLSSLLFALRHARQHGLRRVVYAIPYTSIIEQNADVYRDVFKALSADLGQDIVLEHHSNLQPDTETTRNRLAAENWDAPLIVTTNVQLFESLFACRTSACRKLHRLARSVIVLDEAQALPVGLLRPILAALRCLVRDYRSSVVLCTATQPALERREGFDPGISASDIRPIVADRAQLYEELRRTYPVEHLGRQSNDDLKIRVLAERHGSLVVVNTTKAAREFYSARFRCRCKPDHAAVYQRPARFGCS